MAKERASRPKTEDRLLTPPEAFILGLLREGPDYGYQLRKKARQLSNDKVKLPWSTLYPTLSRLVEEGLIEPAGQSFSKVGHVRKEYRLTSQGATTFEANITLFTQVLGPLSSSNTQS